MKTCHPTNPPLRLVIIYFYGLYLLYVSSYRSQFTIEKILIKMCTVPSFWYSRADTANNKLKTNKELKKVYSLSPPLKNTVKKCV